MVEPIRFGSGAGLAAGAASGPVQRRLRKMSAHPEEPRVFSQAKILISTGLPLSLITTVIMPTPIYDYVTGVSDDIFSIIVPGFITAMSYLLLLHGLFRRFGVDRDKVWTRFGKVFYRQVRFEEIDRFDVGVQRYKLYAGKTKVNIDYNRFDYSLVYIRLLEELQYRRFKLQNIDVDDPQWEDTAQIHRNMFASDVYENHRGFYDAHPDELARLNGLVQAPRSSTN
ncbi:MAG: hypothetical protein L0I94_11315 [Yaniella sp.]|uniref:hypothetical protein n=1 Tax=Yaniella sp. TaxID=2773929 RepID=UPI002648C3F7|nr:hypothetical protein [Yaniella sp.]MDN5818503.1 hypothetical protein [Yaniella sp.]MDN6149400.1 hypothetical protein [Yaniella sp.]MDN6152008.1 hypothetical protein [Yaniella sp.]MDN6457867.1 hypothetical protein [Yaniella sp.]MDN6498978.1 hypothetical protein [Yaniella sp.]